MSKSKSVVYYALIAICLQCGVLYPVESSKNKQLCVECKNEALAWPMKSEAEE